MPCLYIYLEKPLGAPPGFAEVLILVKAVVFRAVTALVTKLPVVQAMPRATPGPLLSASQPPLGLG